MRPALQASGQGGQVDGVGAMAEKNGQLDPICGKRVGADRENLPSSEYKKRRYFFCSDACRQQFEGKAAMFRVHELARAGALLTPGRVRWGIG